MAQNTSDQSSPHAPSQISNVHPVDKRPPFGHMLLLGLQHVLIMYAGAVVVPIVVGTALGLTQEQIADLISIDLLLAGIGTLLQALGLWKFGIKMPLVVGAASNGIVPMILVGQNQGMATIYGSLLISGLLWVILAPFFGRLLRFFPTVVTGTVITLIGLTLIPVGVELIAGSDPESDSYGSLGDIALASFTLVLMVIFYRALRGLLGQLSLLLALVLGAAVGWIMDPSLLKAVNDGPVIGIMHPFYFGALQFHIPSILLFLVIIFVLTVEASGQGLAVGEVVGRKVKPEDITRLLRVDGLMTVLSGVFNGFAYTTFGQNIGLIALTRVHSRYPVAVGGVILIMLGVLQPVGRSVAAIPDPVIGAAAIATFGALAVSGIKLLSTVDFSLPSNLVLVMLSLSVGIIPTGSPDFYKQMPTAAQVLLESGVATGTILAVLLNLIFHGPHQKTETHHDDENVPFEPESSTTQMAVSTDALSSPVRSKPSDDESHIDTATASDETRPEEQHD